MSFLIFVLIGIAIGNIILLLYWQLIVTEGTYLGTSVVTLLYDVMARRYDHIKKYEAESEAHFLGRPLVHALRDVPAPLILDVATGTGRLPLAVFEQPTFNGHVVGLDSSRPMLRIAARKLVPYRQRIDLLWKDARHLPFPHATFDAVTCMEMLEFTPDPEAQLAELVRVLRPGGILLTTRRRGFDARMMPGKTHSLQEFQMVLESLSLERVRIGPWQVDYDLAWAVRSNNGQTKVVSGSRPLVEVLKCPVCEQVASANNDSGLLCHNCGTHFARNAGVLELERISKRSPLL